MRKVLLTIGMSLSLFTGAMANQHYTKNDFANDLGTLSDIYRTAEVYTCYETIQSKMGEETLFNMLDFMVNNSEVFNQDYQNVSVTSRPLAANFYDDWMVTFELLNNLSSNQQNAGDYNRQYCYNHNYNLIYANNLGLIRGVIQNN